MQSQPNPSTSSGRQRQSAIPHAQTPFNFDGPSYVPQRDQSRLTGQILRVYELMRDGKWRTYREISEATGDPEPSISAQLRHLRKKKFGQHTVDKDYIGNGLFMYRLIVRTA